MVYLLLTGSTLQISSDKKTKITADRKILALDLNGKTTELKVVANISLGSVVNSVDNDNKKLTVELEARKSLTLNGTGTTNTLKFANGETANANDYSGLGGITSEGKLIIHSDTNNEIKLNGDINGNGELIVNTPALFTGNEIHVNSINIAKACKAEFKGKNVSAVKIKLQDGASFTFTDSILTLTGAIEAEGKNVLNLNGNTKLLGKIGDTNKSLKEINVNKGSAKLSNGKIRVSNINLKNSAALTLRGHKLIGNITTVENGKGKLTLGTSGNEITVEGNIGASQLSLEEIIVEARNTTLEGDIYTQKMQFDGSNDSEVIISGSLKGEEIQFSRKSTLEFNGTHQYYEFEGKISGGDNATLNVNTSALLANNPTIGTIKAINIQNEKSLIIDAKVGDIILQDNGNAINFVGKGSTLELANTGNEDRTITLSKALNLTKNKTGKVTINSTKENKTLTIKGTLLSDNKKKLNKVILTGRGIIYIGSPIFADKVIFEGANIKSAFNSISDIYTQGTTEFKGTVHNIGNIITQGITEFKDKVANTGVMTFDGTTTFNETLNNNGNIILEQNSITTFTKNVAAKEITVKKDAIITATNTLNLSSKLTANNDVTLNLNSSQITYTGQACFSDKLTINANYNDANSHGEIIIKDHSGGKSQVDLSKLTELAINISGDTSTNGIDENTKYVLISGKNGSIVKPSNYSSHASMKDPNNRFIEWSIELDETSLTLQPKDISASVLKQEAAQNSPEQLKIVEALLSGSNEAKNKGELYSSEGNKDLKNSVQDFQENKKKSHSDEISAIKNNLGYGTTEDSQKVLKQVGNPNKVPVTQALSKVVKSNVVDTVYRRFNAVPTGGEGVSEVAAGAGEEAGPSLGIWASPFIGNSSQKMKGDINDYRTKSSGNTIGFDGFITDNLLLGTSYTNAYTKMKHKNDKLGDESKIKSNIFSLYGLYDCPNSNWFFSGIALYSDSLVKNYSQRLVILGRGIMSSQTAIGKHKSHSYTGQILAGYDYLPSKSLSLKPMIGVSYSKSKDAGYTETGTSFQNLTVKKTAHDLMEGILGFRVAKNINTGHMIVTPELYSFVHRHFKDKSSLVDARLPGMKISFPTSKIVHPKTSFNIGSGLTFKYKMMEYGINYNTNIAKKYFAQQGSLKIRVNF